MTILLIAPDHEPQVVDVPDGICRFRRPRLATADPWFEDDRDRSAPPAIEITEYVPTGSYHYRLTSRGVAAIEIWSPRS